MTRLRRLTQALGMLAGNGYFSVLSSGHIYEGPLKGICMPFLNCYACPSAVFSCPVGSLQHFMTMRVLPLMLVGALGVVGMVVGRMGCGWLCPFGLLQDLLYRIPGPKISIPRPLVNMKYVTLILLVLVLPFATGVPWFSRLCPYGTLTASIPWVLINPVDPRTGQAAIVPGDIGSLFALKLVILGVFLALFVMAKRPFCRTVCPLGAVLSLFNRFSVVRLRVSDGCRRCGSCRERCPVDIQVSEDPGSGECIRCLSCTSCRHVKVQLGAPGLGPGPLFELPEVGDLEYQEEERGRARRGSHADARGSDG